MVEITDKEFKELSSYIKANYGINLKPEKKALVTGRLQPVLQQLQFTSFSRYYEYLISDKSGQAIITFVDKITTNHTFFMRESEHFNYFRDTVLPYLKSTVRDRDMRIWCAACSSGEEAYTLSMIIDEFFGLDKLNWDTKILATDISENVLSTAMNGIYSYERIAPMPQHWRLNYFEKYDTDNAKIIPKLQNEIIFRKFNLMEEHFPFKKKFHVIFCRNVMIYFDNSTQTQLAQKLYNQLEHGGYLFIGHSESINREISGFKYVLPSVYRKN